MRRTGSILITTSDGAAVNHGGVVRGSPHNGGAADADDVLRRLNAMLKKKRMRSSDLFASMDESGDGTLEASEIRDGLKKFGMELGESEFQILWGRLDKDGGGDVSLREFDRALKAADRAHTAAAAAEKQRPRRLRTTRTNAIGFGASTEEAEEIRQIFGLFKQLTRQRRGETVDLVEWDDSGSIAVDDLERLLESVGVRLDDNSLQAVLRAADADNSGTIDYQEFCDAMQRKLQVNYPVSEIAEAFRAFAHDAPEGFIRVQDIRDAIRTCLREVSDTEIEALLMQYKESFKRFPGSDADFLHYQEYIDLMPPSNAPTTTFDDLLRLDLSPTAGGRQAAPHEGLGR